MGDTGRHMGLIGGRMHGRACGAFAGRHGRSVLQKSTAIEPEPGGWIPTDIAGCQLWLKADAGITKDGSNYVSQWADQSGNGNDFIQVIGSYQPLWVDEQVNSLPCIEFDGGGEYLKTSSLSMLPPISLYIVLRKKLTDNNNRYIMDGLQNNTMAFYLASTELKMYSAGYGPSLNISNDVFLLAGSQWNLSNSYLFANNGLKAIGTLGSPLATNGIVVGKIEGYGDNYSLNGSIAEIIMYDNGVSTSDEDLIKTYLNTKYALW